MHHSEVPTMLRRVVLAAASALGALDAAGCAVSVGPAGSDAGPPSHDAAALAPTDAADAPTADAPAAPDARDAASDGPSCDPTVVDSDFCTTTIAWRCGPPPAAALDYQTCVSFCPGPPDGGRWPYVYCYRQYLTDGGATQSVVQCNHCASGRRTEGLVEPDARAPGNPVGEFLANSATLEEGSVTAFERLAQELGALGAPVDLLAALAQAADEERDHTARVGAAARARGVVPRPAQIAPAVPRTALAIAVENAIEGCVRETYGAALAAWQAAHAQDPALAALYTRLARDEAAHAALSWRIDAWLASRLSAGGRLAVRAARAAAVVALARELDAARPDPALVRDAGVPDARAAQTLLAQLAREAGWSPRLAA